MLRQASVNQPLLVHAIFFRCPTDLLLQIAAGCCTAGRPELGVKVLEVLKKHPNIHLFNAALHAAPDSLFLPVVQLLCQGGHEEGAGGAAGWPRPGMDTALLVLERMPPDEMDRSMQLLLHAGLKPHYRVFLAWASWHARRGSIQGVRHVMQLVEEVQLPLAPHYYVQLIRVRTMRGRVGGVGGQQGDAALLDHACLCCLAG